MFELNPWQWTLAIAATFLVGLSKTGIPGVGVLTVAIFANVFPAMESTGVLLPLLVVGDIIAVSWYRQHAVWAHLWRLFPWVAAGIIAGYFAMKVLDNETMQPLIGAILMVMVGVHFWRIRRMRVGGESVPHGIWFAAVMGLAGGFATMVANAAGPIMILYMLAMSLPKMEFMGTGAWYFLILNVFKLPFSWHLGLITEKSLVTDAVLCGAVIAGAVMGKLLLPKLNQRYFEILALALTILAALRLLVG